MLLGIAGMPRRRLTGPPGDAPIGGDHLPAAQGGQGRQPVAQIGEVVPGERGKPPGGQIPVTAARQAVETLHEPVMLLTSPARLMR